MTNPKGNDSTTLEEQWNDIMNDSKVIESLQKAELNLEKCDSSSKF